MSLAPGSRVLCSFLAAALCSFSAAARAEEPEPAPHAASNTTPPDIVRLKNGGMLRGTIVELIPGDHVDVQLVTGEVRRIPASDFDYAGPVPKDPAPPPPPPVAKPNRAAPMEDEVPVRFEAEGGDELRLHIRVAQAEGYAGRGYVHAKGYAQLCVAPCNTSLAIGTHRLAMSQRGGRAIEQDDGVRIDGPSYVQGHYESRSGTRTAGILVLVGGGVVGTVMEVAAFGSRQSCVAGYCSKVPDLDTGLLLGGLGVTLASTLVGVILVVQHDKVTFTVSPLSTAASERPTRADGVVLTARF